MRLNDRNLTPKRFNETYLLAAIAALLVLFTYPGWSQRSEEQSSENTNSNDAGLNILEGVADAVLDKGGDVPLNQVKQPDLVPVIKGPKRAALAESLGDSITVTVKNQGLRKAPQFSVGIYLSRDDHVETRDMLLTGGREFVRRLDANATKQVELNGQNRLPDNLKPGEYYLGVVVDEDNRVFETNETNNSTSYLIELLSNRPERKGKENDDGSGSNMDNRGDRFNPFPPEDRFRPQDPGPEGFGGFGVGNRPDKREKGRRQGGDVFFGYAEVVQAGSNDNHPGLQALIRLREDQKGQYIIAYTNKPILQQLLIEASNSNQLLQIHGTKTSVSPQKADYPEYEVRHVHHYNRK